MNHLETSTLSGKREGEEEEQKKKEEGGGDRRRPLFLPMPTVIVNTGHASGARFLLALSHDYMVMRKDRGFLYMSELNIGLMIPNYFIGGGADEIPAVGERREVVLRAEKVMTVKMGIVDKAYDSTVETLEGGVRLGEELAGRGWDGELYARTREMSYPEACDVLELVDFRPKL